MNTHHSSLITLPIGITSHHRGGYMIRITRGALKLQAYIACAPNSSLATRHSSLQRATALRDRFLITAGEPQKFKTGASPKSNTGFPGICETVKWTHYRPRYCFHVYLGAHHRPQSKRIYYGPKSRTRDQALKLAIALREKLLQKPTKATKEDSTSRPSFPSVQTPEVVAPTHHKSLTTHH